MDSMNKSNQKNSALFARVEGRVQGVGFRYTCEKEARRLELSGWVKNTPGGDVEVWAEGTGENLETFLQWLRKGPPSARVDRVYHEVRIPTGKYQGFGVEFY